MVAASVKVELPFNLKKSTETSNYVRREVQIFLKLVQLNLLAWY